MDNLELKVIYEKEFERLRKITIAIVSSGYSYNFNKKDFILDFGYLKFKDIDNLNDLSDKEKKIILNNQDIEQVIKQLHLNFFRVNNNNSNVGILLDYAKNILYNDDYKLFISDFKIAKIFSQQMLMKMTLNSYEICIEIIDNAKKCISINNRNDIYTFKQILTKTINNAFEQIKEENLDLDNIESREYKSLWNEILYIWTNSLNKRIPNKVYSAIKEILRFKVLENGILSDFSLSIVVSYKNYLENPKDYKKIILKTLFFTFALDKEYHLNNDGLDAVEKLCTATYDGKKVMDKRTYKKYTTDYKTFFSPDFKLTL